MATCARTGKRIFTTERRADDELGWIWSKCRPGRRLESRFYACDFCGRIHLTSKPRRENGIAA